MPRKQWEKALRTRFTTASSDTYNGYYFFIFLQFMAGVISRRKLFMRMKEIFELAAHIVGGGASRVYWVKNEDGTVSIMVRVPTAKGSSERVARLLERASTTVMEIGKRAAEGRGGLISCNAFLGSSADRRLEAVGMATIEFDEGVERNLCMMNIMQVD